LKIKNIIFDFDGTLFDSRPEIINTIKKAFETNCLDYDPGALEKLRIGPPLRDILAELAGKANAGQLDKLIASFRLIYDNSAFDATLPYPGCMETLDKLLKKNINLFIATNKPGLCTGRIIEKHGLRHYFKEIVNIDSIAERRLSKYEMLELLIDRFDMVRAETLMIGDTARDIEAACKSGIKSSIAAYGYGDLDVSVKQKALFVMHKFCDILEFL
jgi:phosphoglycolate phosphatase